MRESGEMTVLQSFSAACGTVGEAIATRKKQREKNHLKRKEK
jgi:hypothetical protein